MLRWMVRVLIVVIASVMFVWITGAMAGALTRGTGGGYLVPEPGEAAPVVIPSPERPPGYRRVKPEGVGEMPTGDLLKKEVLTCVVSGC